VNTYYYYGGILVDAVALNGCTQAGPEQFEELGLMMGTLDTVDPLLSSLRAFRGDWGEVINDGSDGQAAVVRVHGADDFFWLVELELIKAVYIAGLDIGQHLVKPLSNPMGIDVYVDYILDPDSRVLQIDLHFTNLNAEENQVLAGTEIFFGDVTTLKYYNDSVEDFLGYGLATGVPWLVSASGTGSYAFAIKDAVMATTNIAEVDAALDYSQMSAPIILAPAGQAGDTATETFFMSVGAGDFNSSIVNLHEYNPEPLPGMTTSNLLPFEGTAYDTVTLSPIPDADIELQVLNQNSVWKFLTGFKSDESGWFGGDIPDLGVEYRLVAHAAGRPDPAPVQFMVSLVPLINVGFAPGGILAYDVRDTLGRNLPAKIFLWQGGSNVHRIYSTTGAGQEALAPGSYEVSVTRGYEYTTYQGAVDHRG